MPKSNPPNSPPGNSAFGQMVAFLRQNKPAGMSQGDWNQIVTAQIGNNANGRGRAQIARELADWFATFPKAGA